jgi:hypothetical protein
MCFIVLYTLAFEFISIFQCQPIQAFWDFTAKAKGHCVNTIPVFYLAGVCNILTDLVLMAIVVPKIRELQIPRGQKTALLGIVSLGWLAILASIIRLVRLSSILLAQDKAWASYDINIWSGVELNVGMICASAPTIKPVLAKLLPQLMTKLTSRHLSRDYAMKDYQSKVFPIFGHEGGSKATEQSQSMTALADKRTEEIVAQESQERLQRAS